MKIWKLKAGSEHRFREGHPWLYSNELAESPKGLEPGAAVELQDSQGRYLARGYGNPHSLIAFRALSRNPAIAEPLSASALSDTLESALALRTRLGVSAGSYRLCFGEGDGLPGLIIDSYKLAADAGRVLVLQAHTAGMDRVLPLVIEALQTKLFATEAAQQKLGIVVRNDVYARELEGLKREAPRVLATPAGVDLEKAQILVSSATQHSHEDFLLFDTDLISGQKTGFFLDQRSNVRHVVDTVFNDYFNGTHGPTTKPLRILDLCCYVGQWSTQLAAALKARNIPAAFTLVDASASALARAQNNVLRHFPEASCESIEADVWEALSSKEMLERRFDLIVCDPPALIKGRKDLHAGKRAYLKLNAYSLGLLNTAGIFVSCSCSALFDEGAFSAMLAEAAHKRQRRLRWVARGTQSPDHPTLAEFPEGRYLKMCLAYAD